MLVAVGLAPALLRVACEIRMSTGGKHSRGTSGSPTEKEAKQAKPSDSPTHESEAHQAQEEKPSEREIKAALAARERLYGERTGRTDLEVTIFFSALPHTSVSLHLLKPICYRLTLSLISASECRKKAVNVLLVSQCTGEKEEYMPRPASTAHSRIV